MFRVMKLKQKDLFNKFKPLLLTCDNKVLWSYCAELADAIQAKVKEATSKANSREDMDDESLRAALRSLLVTKLRDQSLSAAEIAQLKDIFHLTAPPNELSVALVQFDGVVAQPEFVAMPDGLRDDSKGAGGEKGTGGRDRT